MDLLRRLLFLGAMAALEHSASSEHECEKFEKDTIYCLEGEGLYYLNFALRSYDYSNDSFTWYKMNKSFVSSDERSRVHFHDATLFLLNVSAEDAGIYLTWHNLSSGKCNEYELQVNVLEANQRADAQVLYGEIDNPGKNKEVKCPWSVALICEKPGGNLTWYKNFTLIPGEHKKNLWLRNTSEQAEAIYTCICTWTHNRSSYNVSGSRWLRVKETSFSTPLQILSPVRKEQLVDKGSPIKLNCSVHCGTNVLDSCWAEWEVDPKEYHQDLKVEERTDYGTVATATLTIDYVSDKDLKTEFKCVITDMYSTESKTLHLKQRETIIPSVILCTHMFLFFVLMAILVKCFAINLVLIFRRFQPCGRQKKDGKVYDAYVVYQGGKVQTEDLLYRFVFTILPSVLEDKCGYRLFIQGRDDIPGEDHLEMVEDRMKKSRRLMVILTPGLGTASETADKHLVSPPDASVGGFDWQVGLHQALVQREMRVILIQLGDMGPQGYKNLPPGLQHLVANSAPLKWPDGTKGAAASNSGFWKRVRYLMPSHPASGSKHPT